jgi:hypothetical protein
MKASRTLIAGAAAALLPLAGAFAQSPQSPQENPPTQPPQQSQGASFESLDTDSDGRISKVEAAAHPQVDAQFSRYDKNGNGYIERDEVTAPSPSAPKDPGQ